MPQRRRLQISESVTLETIHVAGSEPAVVFVHAGLGSLWNPYPQLDTFDGEQELVTYALAGKGNSTTHSEQSLAWDVTDLRNLLDTLNIDRPIVHGHGYGTAIALEYAKRHPNAGFVPRRR